MLGSHHGAYGNGHTLSFEWPSPSASMLLVDCTDNYNIPPWRIILIAGATCSVCSNNLKCLLGNIFQSLGKLFIHKQIKLFSQQISSVTQHIIFKVLGKLMYLPEKVHLTKV